MLVHKVLVWMPNLQPQKPCGDSATNQDRQRSKAPKEMQRPTHVAKQKPNGHQIEEHAEGAANAVMAFAALAVQILDGNFANGRTEPAGQRRNKAMHLPIEGNILDHLTAICL